MNTKLIQFNLKQREKEMPRLKAGDWVKVHRKVKEGKKERIQIFEGMIIAIKGKQSSSPMITVRKVSNGIGVEIIVPIYSPFIEKIELIKRAKVRRAKLYYVRKKTAKSLRFKFTEMQGNNGKESEKEEVVNLNKKEKSLLKNSKKETNSSDQKKSENKDEMKDKLGNNQVKPSLNKKGNKSKESKVAAK